MIDLILAALHTFVVTVISTLGYPGVALLMAIESACIPLPSELIMPYAGFLAHTGRFNLWLAALAGAIGCNVGSVVAYEIGYYGGRPLVQKFGRIIWLSQHELDLADRLFTKHGGITILISRMLPVIRTFIALPAGVARMPRTRFHIYTFVGSFPWCLGLAYVGVALGEQWDKDPRLKMWFHRFDAVILAVLVIGTVWFFWTRWKNRIKEEPSIP
jgi:membrane protein DedA with SNARE-associated domain